MKTAIPHNHLALFVSFVALLLTSPSASAATWFDGVAANLQVPGTNQLSITGSITISAWINRPYVNTTSTTDPIICKGRKASSAVCNWVFRVNENAAGTAQTLEFYWATGGFNQMVCPTANVVASSNTWYHVAVVHTWGSAGTLQFWVNGIAYGAKTLGGSSNAAATANTDVTRIGIDSGGTFPGQLAEIAVWNIRLTPGEIQQLYNNSKSPIAGRPLTIEPASLVGYWPLDAPGYNLNQVPSGTNLIPDFSPSHNPASPMTNTLQQRATFPR